MAVHRRGIHGTYGVITGDGSNTYGYDGIPNMVCSNCLDSIKSVYYWYDATNSRVARDTGAELTYEFTNARGQLLLEYTPSLNDKTVEHI